MTFNQHTEIAEHSAHVLILQVSEGTLVIQASEIIRIESVSNYSRIFLFNGRKITVAKVLHWFEEQESLISFIRIHRTHLVNSFYITSLNGKRKNLLQLRNGEVFPVARRRRALLLEEIKRLNLPVETMAASAKELLIKKNMAA
jgi:two-component system LytT family response regulator